MEFNMSYPYLTAHETIAKAQEFYPECFYGAETDSLVHVQVRLMKLARCDDLTPTEQYKVYVLLPNINECLT